MLVKERDEVLDGGHKCYFFHLYVFSRCSFLCLEIQIIFLTYIVYALVLMHFCNFTVSSSTTSLLSYIIRNFTYFHFFC